MADTGVTPKGLKHGDTVAFISPSSRVNHIFPHRIDRAKAVLEALGLRVEILYSGPEESKVPASIKQRLAEFHTAFRRPDIKAVIFTIGGLHANELLPYIDYELIKQNPKILCGYSDATLIHHALLTKANLRTFYGPAAIPTLGEFPEPLTYSLNHFKRVFFESIGEPLGPLPASTHWTRDFRDWADDELRGRKEEQNSGWKWLRKGQAEGRIRGGCLPSVLQTIGTEYSPSYEGVVLFLETPEWTEPWEPMPFAFVRSNLGDLAIAGVFGVIKGLVLGRPGWYSDEDTQKWHELVLEVTDGLDFPILADVDIGHTDPIMTLPLNAMVRLDSGHGSDDVFEVLEPAVL